MQEKENYLPGRGVGENLAFGPTYIVHFYVLRKLKLHSIVLFNFCLLQYRVLQIGKYVDMHSVMRFVKVFSNLEFKYRRLSVGSRVDSRGRLLEFTDNL